jgi:hypothetical protein
VEVDLPQGLRLSSDGLIFFTTTEHLVAPPGDFVAGSIQPSQTSVGIVAEEPGPSGNVAAGAINRVENRNVDGFLKAYASNTGRRVTNPDPTSGGDNNEEPEITQEDVNAAVAMIQADLAGQLQQQLSEDPTRVYGPADAGDPVVDVPGDLVGTTGQETFNLGGSLTYRRDYVQRDAVEQAARERLAQDDFVGPEGITVLADEAQVEIGDVTEADGQLRVQATVRAEAVPSVDVDAVRNRVAGMTDLQVIQALGDLGDVSVTLWPGWVDHVPQLNWRIDVQVEGQASQSPGASPTAATSP